MKLAAYMDPHLLSWERPPQALETGRAAELEHCSATMNGLLPNRVESDRGNASSMSV